VAFRNIVSALRGSVLFLQMRTVLSAFLCTIAALHAPSLFSQNQPYSTLQHTSNIFEELGRPVIRPSRISGGHLLNGVLPAVPVEVSETDERLSLETALWLLEVKKAPWELRLTNKQSGAKWRLAPTESHSASVWWQIPGNQKTLSSQFNLLEVHQVQRNGNRWTMKGNIATATQPVTLGIAVLTPNVLQLSFAAPPLENGARLGLSLIGEGPFFGLGERFGKAKLDGLKTTLRTTDKFTRDPDHNWTYAPVPFLFTPHGLGFYIDTAWPSTFDLTGAAQKQFSVELAGPSTDCYFFVDQGPKGIIENYTSLTGRTPLPPPWAFGVWVNVTKGLRDLGGIYDDSALSEARRLRELRIPTSALWVQDLVDPSTNIGFPLWTAGYYGSPRQFVEGLHKMGFKVLVYTNPWAFALLAPYILPNPTYEYGAHEGNFVLGPDGHVSSPVDFDELATGNIDFTKPEAASWWETMKRKSITDYDVDGWMEDFGEQVRDTDQFAIGRTGLDIANIYPSIYHNVTYETATRLKPDFVEFSRSGYAGSQAYTPVLWGGDQAPNWDPYNGLPSLVPAGITAGLSGFAIWGPDIQSAGTSKELWMRWLEFGALTPVMRDHKWDRPKWGVDLWFDSETIDLFRRYAELHMSLFPYLYTYAQAATKTGLPIMRHLMLEYPNDPAAWNVDDEYLLGEKILVAPVLMEGATTRSLYLPRGLWMDYWTEKFIDGGRWVEVPAPLDQIPILIRAGTVIPLIDPETQTLASDLTGGKYRTLNNAITWRVIPVPGSFRDDFTLYDGTKMLVNQDSFSTEVKGEGSPVLRQYELILPVAEAPGKVLVSGEKLGRLDDPGYRAHKTGWWLSSDKHSLHVLFLRKDFTVRVTGR